METATTMNGDTPPPLLACKCEVGVVLSFFLHPGLGQLPCHNYGQRQKTDSAGYGHGIVRWNTKKGPGDVVVIVSWAIGSSMYSNFTNKCPFLTNNTCLHPMTALTPFFNTFFTHFFFPACKYKLYNEWARTTLFFIFYFLILTS